MSTKICRQSKLTTADDHRPVYSNGFGKYSLELVNPKWPKAEWHPVTSTEYHASYWKSAKAKVLAKAEAQVDVKLVWVRIEPREVHFASIIGV